MRTEAEISSFSESDILILSNNTQNNFEVKLQTWLGFHDKSQNLRTLGTYVKTVKYLGVNSLQFYRLPTTLILKTEEPIYYI